MTKRAKDATDDENAIPGTQADASPTAAHIMRELIRTTERVFPGTHVCVIVMEPGHEGGGRFNYASNVERADMLALLKALLKRLRVAH
jgi:hypothetical protein